MHIANYKAQRQAFDLLLKEDCDKPILLLKGNSGIGKTTLMDYCRHQISGIHHNISVGLQDTTIAHIFFHSSRCLGQHYFENFKIQLEDLKKQFNVQVNGNKQIGIGHNIHLELNALFNNISLEQRQDSYTHLTHAWAEDINHLDKLCVLFLDRYEYAPNEIQRWITHDFLSCVAYSKKMRVVIAGQYIPENFTWNQYAEIKELNGVHEAKEWLSIIEAKKLKAPPMDILESLCNGFLKGNPSDIMKMIEALPANHE